MQHISLATKELGVSIVSSLVLVHIAVAARYVLQKGSKYCTLQPSRQNSLAALVAVMIGKCLLTVWCVPMLAGEWTFQYTMDLRLAFILSCSIYIFDMTFRKVSLSLWVHHIAAILVAACIMMTATYDSSDTYLMRTTCVFYVFGIGLADLSADLAILSYYMLGITPRLDDILKYCSYTLTAFRVAQWALCIRLVYTEQPGISILALMLPSYMIWLREDYLEWVVITGLARRVRKQLLESFFHSPAVLDISPVDLLLLGRPGLTPSRTTENLAQQWGLGGEERHSSNE